MGLTYTIITGDLQRKLSRIPELIKLESRITIKESLAKVQLYSSRHHIYKRQSGNADKAYSTAFPSDFEGVLRIDDYISNAPYTKYLHEGTKSESGRTIIKPMKFLYKAFKRYTPSIKRQLRGIPSRAIKRAGF